MKTPLPESLYYCKYAGRWIIAENPKKCSNYYGCEDCEFHIKRPLNKYIIKKLRRLEKENEVQKIL